ncbi:ribonuclease H-like domain-containing protein [Tanacetum coccineum]
MFSIRIHLGGSFRMYPCRRYVDGHVDIFDMVDIDLFSVIALNRMVLQLGYTGEFEPLFYNYLRPLSTLDEGLYDLACDEDVHCLATFVRSFKLLEVYIEHGYTVVDSYQRQPPQVRTTIEYITEPGTSATFEHRSDKMLLLTWHDSSTSAKESICDSLTPSQVIEDVMRQLSFEKTELVGEAGFNDVVGSGIDSFGLSYDESFGVDDLILNLNINVDLNVTQTKTQAELPVFEVIVSEEVDVSRTEVPVPEEADEPVEAPSDEQVDYDVERINRAYETQYHAESSEDAGTDDDDEDDDFFDVVNPDGFHSDTGNDNETINYRRRRLDELRREIEGVMNASGQWKVRARCEEKVHVFTMSQGTGPTGPNQGKGVGPNGLSGPRTRSKKKKSTEIPVKAVQDQLQRDLELQSTNPNTTVKIGVERNIDPSLPTRVFKRIYICLGALKMSFRARRRKLLGLDGAFMKGPFLGQVLAAVGLDLNNGIYIMAYALVDSESNSSWYWFLNCLGGDIDLQPNSNFTFISDRQKGIIPSIKTVFPSAKHRFCLRHIHENVKQGWCGQAYKDLLWRYAFATTVGRPKKKRKRSQHEDEPFVKDGKLSKKGRTITCQSCKNIGHNKATCKGQEANGSAFGQAQQAEPAVGQDGSGGLGVGDVIGLSATGGQNGSGGAGVGVGSLGNGYSRKGAKRKPKANKSKHGKERTKSSRTSDKGKFVVDESQKGKSIMLIDEDIYCKKVTPLAEEIMDRVLSQSASHHNYQLDGFEMKTGFGWWWFVPGIIMENLVKDSKKARILELKQRYFEDYCSEDQYPVSIKEDTAYLCLHSPKTTNEQDPIRRIQEDQYAAKHIEYMVGDEAVHKELDDRIERAATTASSLEAEQDSGITRIVVNGKNAYDLKGKFLDDLHKNAFSGTHVEVAIEHIEYFFKIIDPIDLPNVNRDKLRVVVLAISLAGDA